MPTLPRKILRRALRPMVRLYYRFLFGWSFPGAAAGARWIRRLEALAGGGDLPLSRAAWEAQYGDGTWTCLRRDDEQDRYRALLGLLERHAAGARRILDVGCGEAILRDLLPAGGYELYLGVDLSLAAVAGARKGARPHDRLVVADAEAWAPARRFDAVVMNECLYYFHDPLAEAWRFLDAVAPSGALLVSMFESPRTRAILRALARRLPPAEVVRVPAGTGAWSLAAFRRATEDPPSAPTPR
jgi:SAM-dependent methyltransferase